ncbi:FAD-binding oxidoreductase [Streptomyces sp. bgisy095]|uniref:FAD-binding oxidoreductase n=1 Tax=unclassified Streptomyces TaxID=2593676 RepID=UPI003D72028B
MLTDPALCAAYESDFTGRYTARARLVVRPADTAQVARVVRLCREAGAPLLPQGGNTGLVGASAPGGAGEVVLSLRRLTGIGPVDAAARQVTVGAGLPLAGLQRQKPCLIRA